MRGAALGIGKKAEQPVLTRFKTRPEKCAPAVIHPDNAASIRLVMRLGFRCEGGPLRDYWRVGDEYASVMMYALLAGERP